MKIDPKRMAQASRDLASLSIQQIACRHRPTFLRRKWVVTKWRFEYVCDKCGAHLDVDRPL